MPKQRDGDRFFEPDTLRYLRELARNNNRDWFLKNKARYEQSVQTPALRFIDAMAACLATVSPYLRGDSRPFGGSLSRIYRDTRFAKDKSPYKTHVGIHFFHEKASKGVSLPGFFFHLAPGESRIHSGMWHPEPRELTKIRDAIVATPAAWGRVVKDGLTIEGESYSRVPRGYAPDHRYATDLRRKDFFASQKFSDAEISSATFGSDFIAACRELDPLNKFLAKAIGLPW
ncbi:MAG: TIGR02453 family protein [Thermoplasmata archaeon]